LETNPLLRRNVVEFARTLLIKKGAFGFVAAAPMLVAARNEEIIARSDALFAGVILIEISAFDDHDGNVVGVRVHACIEAGIELGKCSMRALVRVAPYGCHGYAGCRRRRRLVCALRGRCVDDVFALLSLRNSYESRGGDESRNGRPDQ